MSREAEKFENQGNSGAIAAIKKPEWKPKQFCWICGQYHWLSECPILTEAEKKEVTARKRTEISYKKLRSLSDAEAKSGWFPLKWVVKKLPLFLLVHITDKVISCPNNLVTLLIDAGMEIHVKSISSKKYYGKRRSI